MINYLNLYFHDYFLYFYHPDYIHLQLIVVAFSFTINHYLFKVIIKDFIKSSFNYFKLMNLTIIKQKIIGYSITQIILFNSNFFISFIN